MPPVLPVPGSRRAAAVLHHLAAAAMARTKWWRGGRAQTRRVQRAASGGLGGEPPAQRNGPGGTCSSGASPGPAAGEGLGAKHGAVPGKPLGVDFPASGFVFPAAPAPSRCFISPTPGMDRGGVDPGPLSPASPPSSSRVPRLCCFGAGCEWGRISPCAAPSTGPVPDLGGSRSPWPGAVHTGSPGGSVGLSPCTGTWAVPEPLRPGVRLPGVLQPSFQGF